MARSSDSATPSSRSDAAAQAAQTLEPQQVRMHSAEARQAALRRFTLENELRRAIEQDEFELHYQPVVDVQADRSVGGEALIRWRHPERGMVPPGEFIPILEEIGLINEVGRWVMHQANAMDSSSMTRVRRSAGEPRKNASTTATPLRSGSQAEAMRAASILSAEVSESALSSA